MTLIAVRFRGYPYIGKRLFVGKIRDDAFLPVSDELFFFSFLIKAVSSMLNYHLMIYTVNLVISSLPPEISRIYLHVWAECWCIIMMFATLFRDQSLVYCLLSSTIPQIYFVSVMVLSILVTLHPLQCFSMTRIIGTLLKNQLVPDEPELYPVPCNGISEVLV